MGGRRGLGRRFGSVAAESPAEVGVFRAKVLSVNTVKYTCTVQGELDNQRFTDIPVEPVMLNAEGGGSYWMPETNSLVWLCHPSTSSTPFVMSGATAPAQLTEDPSEDPTDRRFNRPVLNEGDYMVAQNGSGRIILRKGGIVEIGSGESSLRRYIPLTNLIEEFSQNWRHNSAAGLMEMICRDQDATYGTEKTPAEFRFNLREFCEDTFPSMDLRIGRIQDEDDQSIPSGEVGAVIARLAFNDRVTWWVDRDGNIARRVMGSSFESHEGSRRVVTQGSVRDVVKGTLDGQYASRRLVVNTTDSLKVTRDRTVEVGGNLRETVAKSVVRKTGNVTEELGAVERSIKGPRTESITGFVRESVGDNRETSVGGDDSETVTKTKNIVVTGQGANSRDVSFQVTVKNGIFRVHNTTGAVVFASGNMDAGAAPCRVFFRPSGAIVLSSGVGAVELEVNTTGFRVKTAAGEISLDASGTVVLGPGPARGNVLTTLTHPVDLTSGVPLMGSTSVQAGNTGVASGPAAVPSSFAKDNG